MTNDETRSGFSSSFGFRISFGFRVSSFRFPSMAEVARVHNLEALKRFKQALWKFQETVNVALTDAESDMQRTSIWLETEQRTYWTSQHRKRHEAVEKAKQAVREKQLYKDASGTRSSAVDEMKILKAAERAL